MGPERVGGELANRLQLWGAVPERFDDAGFDNAERSIKCMVVKALKRTAFS